MTDSPRRPRRLSATALLLVAACGSAGPAGAPTPAAAGSTEEPAIAQRVLRIGVVPDPDEVEDTSNRIRLEPHPALARLGRGVLLVRPTTIEARATALRSLGSGELGLQLALSDSSREELGRVAAERVNRQVALYLDGVYVSDPILEGPMGETRTISLDFMFLDRKSTRLNSSHRQ